MDVNEGRGAVCSLNALAYTRVGALSRALAGPVVSKGGGWGVMVWQVTRSLYEVDIRKGAEAFKSVGAQGCRTPSVRCMVQGYTEIA